MLNKLKAAIIILAVMLQIISAVLFGFTEIQVSAFSYMVIWAVCGLIISRLLGAMKVN